MSAKPFVIVVLLTSTCLTHAVRAARDDDPHTPATRTGAAFRSSVDLVALTVTVTDQQRRFVTGLAQDDFVVTEDGVPQPIAIFARNRVPLDLAIAIDTSGSMRPVLSTAHRAAIDLVETTHPGDCVMVAGINDRANILAPLTPDTAAVTDAIKRTDASGRTALYTGLYVTLTELMHARDAGADARRQALVVLSDGQDTASLIDYGQVMELVGQAGVTIYTIALAPSPADAWAGGSTTPDPFYVMRSFAEATGGRVFVARKTSDLAGIYGTIADELSQQYVLGYASTNPHRDGAFRHVTVRVISRPGTLARTRTGYYAPRG
jgi:VWFA-related protein